MQICCPICEAELELTVEVLAAAEGLIRCGECETAFNALALIPAEALDQAEQTNDQPKPAARSDLPMDDLFEESPETLAPGTGPPLQLGGEEAITRSGHWWAAAALALTVLMGLQLIAASTGVLSRMPATRPLAEAVCAIMGCEVPAVRDLEAISLLNRDVRRHPSVEGALMITATMSSLTASAQPFPVIEIRLSDLDGRPLALRRFSAEEYLAADTDIAAGMPPDVLVPMSFEVVDPGNRAVAFEFSFR